MKTSPSHWQAGWQGGGGRARVGSQQHTDLQPHHPVVKLLGNLLIFVVHLVDEPVLFPVDAMDVPVALTLALPLVRVVHCTPEGQAHAGGLGKEVHRPHQPRALQPRTPPGSAPSSPSHRGSSFAAALCSSSSSRHLVDPNSDKYRTTGCGIERVHSACVL